MPVYYTYLIASLPMPHFGAKPPLSFEKFLTMCKGLIRDDEFELLESFAKGEDRPYQANAALTLKRWKEFDTALRNELVKVRASRKHIEPSKYLRENTDSNVALMHTVTNIVRNPSLLEAEKALDLQRWRFLEELAFGHYFDMDYLILYAQKLLILERWERINTADKSRLLEEAVKIN